MNERIGPLLLAVIALTALGAAAATVDDATSGGGLGMLDGPDGSLSGGPSMDTAGETDRPWLSPGPAAATPGEAAISVLQRLVVPLAAIAAWIGLAVYVFRRSTGDDDRVDGPAGVDTDDATEPWHPTPRDGVAGAWWELVSRIDADGRRTLTPGEAAERATGDGFAADAVTDLTTLFERVRYGGAAASDQRVAAARDALGRALDTASGADVTAGPDSQSPDTGGDDGRSADPGRTPASDLEGSGGRN
jgi:hypothetical protein